MPISPEYNGKEINSVLWLSTRFQSIDYDPNTDMFLFVLGSPAGREHRTRDTLVIGDFVTLYDTITHRMEHQGIIQDVYLLNKKNVLSIVMVRKRLIAPGT